MIFSISFLKLFMYFFFFQYPYLGRRERLLGNQGTSLYWVNQWIIWKLSLFHIEKRLFIYLKPAAQFIICIHNFILKLYKKLDRIRWYFVIIIYFLSPRIITYLLFLYIYKKKSSLDILYCFYWSVLILIKVKDWSEYLDFKGEEIFSFFIFIISPTANPQRTTAAHLSV